MSNILFYSIFISYLCFPSDDSLPTTPDEPFNDIVKRLLVFASCLSNDLNMSVVASGSPHISRILIPKSQAFARSFPSSNFASPYFFKRIALMLMNPVVSTGLKFNTSIENSDSSYSFSVSELRPIMSQLPL